MRHTTRLRHPQRKTHRKLKTKKATNGHATLSTKKVKGIYRKSLAGIKKHPYQSIGILTLGAGVLSGMYMMFKTKKRSLFL